MSVTGIASSILSALNSHQTNSTNSPNTQSQMNQLGQDLQSGNFKQALSDFTALSQNFPGGNGTSSVSNPASNNPLGQTFNQLGQDLQSGNLQAAQRDYATLQQELQQYSALAGGHHHHHHHSEGSQNSASTQQSNPFAQAFSQLAQVLQS